MFQRYFREIHGHGVSGVPRDDPGVSWNSMKFQGISGGSRRFQRRSRTVIGGARDLQGCVMGFQEVLEGFKACLKDFQWLSGVFQ